MEVHFNSPGTIDLLLSKYFEYVDEGEAEMWDEEFYQLSYDVNLFWNFENFPYFP